MICEQNGRLLSKSSCADDEWCVGPTNSTNSRYQVDTSCVKGNGRRRYLNAVLVLRLKSKTNVLND